MMKKQPDGTVTYEGYCVDLLKELAKKLHFTYEIYPSPDGLYGVEKENGTWDGMIAELIHKVCELIYQKGGKDCLEDQRLGSREELKMASLVYDRDMHTINLTFKCLQKSPPMFLKDYIKAFRTINNTRGSGKNIMLPKVRNETARKSFYFKGSKLFKDIPNEMKDINSVMILKTRILEFYRSQAF